MNRSLSVRSIILTGLIVNKSPAVVAGLLPLLGSEDANLRNGAIEALQQMPDEVAPHVEAMLADPDSDVRILAVNVLSALPHPMVPEWLRRVVTTDPHVNVCAAALDALAEVGEPERDSGAGSPCRSFSGRGVHPGSRWMPPFGVSAALMVQAMSSEPNEHRRRRYGLGDFRRGIREVLRILLPEDRVSCSMRRKSISPSGELSIACTRPAARRSASTSRTCASKPPATEMQRLVNQMTVNETYFFREDYQLKALVEGILPDLAARRNGSEPIRLWSVPCSSGEEPYSLAIYILEQWADADRYDIEIMASDIDSAILAEAAAGVYGERCLAASVAGR